MANSDAPRSTFEVGTAIAALVTVAALVIIYLFGGLTDQYRLVAAGLLAVGLVFAGLSWGGYLDRGRTRWRNWRKDRRLRQVLPALVVELDAVTKDAQILLSNDSSRVTSVAYMLLNVTERVKELKLTSADKVDAARCTFTENRTDWNEASMEIWRLCQGEARASLTAYQAALNLLKANVGYALGVWKYVVVEVRKESNFSFSGSQLDRYEGVQVRARDVVQKIQHLILETESVVGELQMTWFVEVPGALRV